MGKANTTNRSDPSGAAAQAPTNSTQQTTRDWSDFGSVDKGDSHYGANATVVRDDDGWGGRNTAATRGKHS